MQAFVDADICSGCGLCVDTCPEVFEIEGEVAVVKDDEVPEEARDSCVEAAESCPVGAITIDESDDE